MFFNSACHIIYFKDCLHIAFLLRLINKLITQRFSDKMGLEPIPCVFWLHFSYLHLILKKPKTQWKTQQKNGLNNALKNATCKQSFTSWERGIMSKFRGNLLSKECTFSRIVGTFSYYFDKVFGKNKWHSLSVYTKLLLSVVQKMSKVDVEYLNRKKSCM